MSKNQQDSSNIITVMKDFKNEIELRKFLVEIGVTLELDAALVRTGTARRALAIVGEQLVDHQLPAHPVALHPRHRVVGGVDQRGDQVGVGAALAHQVDVAGEALRLVGRHRDPVGPLGPLLGQQRPQVVEPAVGEAEDPAREPAVAAALLTRCRLEHQHAGALFLRGDGGAERGIAGADNDDVEFFYFGHGVVSAGVRS